MMTDYISRGAALKDEDIGKTFFLTREEAERAMQEMEGKKDGKT